jgi:hypothetical protein
VALGGLANFERSAREALVTIEFLNTIVNDQGKFAETDRAMMKSELLSLGTDFHVCLLKTLREARMISHALSPENPAVNQVQQCKPEMLTGLERLTLAAADSYEKPDVTFHGGLLLSEVSTAPPGVPFFEVPSDEWRADMRGINVPAIMAKGEEMLLGGLEGSQQAEKAAKAKACTIQLAAHATFLAQLKVNAGAEWRYRASAEVAQKYGHARMASSSFAQLSYFLMLDGQQEQALEAANASLRLGNDALASYLQASLQLNLGTLRSDGQLRETLAQLQAVKGKLPSDELEESRAAMEGNLDWWRERTDSGSIRTCFTFPDAATTLVCILGRVGEMFA